MDAFELLDHNCWSYIFRKLNAEDLLSCSLVCKPFSDLLDEEKFQRRWKFELVLPLLFPHLKLKYYSGGVSWKNLLRLRLVCPSWRESIDKYATDYDPTFFSHFNHTKDFPLATRLSSSARIKDFIQMFGELNGNPFPAKTVYISRVYEHLEGGQDAFLGLQQTQAYIENVTNFSERFGRNILKLYLDINLQYYNTDCLFVCKLIKGATMHLPNLKTLRVSGYNYDFDDDQPDRDDPQEVDAWMEENELPDLPQLQALEIYGLNEIAENYLVEKYAPQLTHFKRNYNFPQNILQQLQPQLFGKLEKLSLDLQDHDYAEALEPLRLLQSPLKMFKLTLSRGLNEFFTWDWNMAKALRNLQHLPIEYLEIRLHHHVNVTEGDLHLEDYMNKSIQTLNLHFCYYDHDEDGQISFNFLRALTKLEILKLKFCSAQNRIGVITHPESLPEEVDLHEYLVGGEGIMLHHSNIWEKVASLKTLILKAQWPQFTVTNQEDNSTYYRRDPDFKSKSTFTRDQYEMVMNEDALGEIGLINLQ